MDRLVHLDYADNDEMESLISELSEANPRDRERAEIYCREAAKFYRDKIFMCSITDTHSRFYGILYASATGYIGIVDHAVDGGPIEPGTDLNGSVDSTYGSYMRSKIRALYSDAVGRRVV